MPYFSILLICIFFIFSLLIYFPAPTNFLWKISVLIGGFAHFLALFFIIMAFFANSISFSIAFGTLAILYFKTYLDAFLVAKKEMIKIDHLSIWFPFYFKKVTKSTLEYSEGLYLDFYSYHKNHQNKQPLLVVIHGGSWSSGSKEDLPELNHFLALNEIKVAAVSYHLAPDYQFPIPLNDVKNAIFYLKSNAEKLGIDEKQIFVLGRSAGGQLAQLAGYELGNEIIKGIISYYTPADLVWGYENPASNWVHPSRKVLEAYLGGGLHENYEKYKSASPVYCNFENAPFNLMLHGKQDVLVAYGHNLRLIKALGENSKKYRLVTFNSSTHGFDYFFKSPTAQVASKIVLKFITNAPSRTL